MSKNLKLSSPINSYPVNNGFAISSSIDDIALGTVTSRSLLFQIIKNNTYDLMLIRSFKNGDTKGIWMESLSD